MPESSRSRVDSRGIADWRQLRSSSLLDDPTLRFGKILWRIQVVKEHRCRPAVRIQIPGHETSRSLAELFALFPSRKMAEGIDMKGGLFPFHLFHHRKV